MSPDPSLNSESLRALPAGRVKMSRRFVRTVVPWLVVAAVVGLIVELMTPRVMCPHSSPGRETRWRVDIVTLRSALDDYCIQHGGRYPTELQALYVPDEHGNTYLGGNAPPRDAWNSEYQFDPPSREYPAGRVWCLGQDGQPGGEGDDADVSEFDIEVPSRRDA